MQEGASVHQESTTRKLKETRRKSDEAIDITNNILKRRLDKLTPDPDIFDLPPEKPLVRAEKPAETPKKPDTSSILSDIVKRMGNLTKKGGGPSKTIH